MNKQTKTKQTKTKQTLEEPAVTNGEMTPARTQRNPNSLANLKPIQPGEVRNPAGRPKDTPLISPAVRRFLQMPWEDFRKLDPLKMTVAEAMAWQQVMQSMDREDENSLKARHKTWDKDDPGDKRGDTINIDKAVLVRYVEGD